MTSIENPQLDFLTLVRQWDRRARLQQISMLMPRMVMPGLLIGITLAVVSRLRPLLTNQQVLLTTAGLVAALPLIMTLVVLFWRRSLVQSARRFDVEFGLKERVSTALELMEGRIRTDEALASHQLEDAYRQASAVRPHERLPLTPDRRDWGMVGGLTAVLFAILLFFPSAEVENLARQQQAAAIEEAADEIKDTIEEVAANETLSEEQRQSLLETLQENLETLQDEEITPEEAFASLEEVETTLQEQSDAQEQQAQAEQNALNNASTSLQDTQQTSDAQGTEGTESQPLNEALESMAQDLESMTPEERQQAADALEQAAQALSETNPALSDTLQQAADALRNGNLEEAQQALDQAAQQAQQAQQQADQTQQSSNQLEQSAQQAGQNAQQIAQAGQPQNGQQGQQGENGQQGQQGQNGQQSGGDQQGSQSGGNSPEGGNNPGQGGSPNTGAGMDNSQSGGGSSSEGGANQSGTGAGDSAGDLGQDTSGSGSTNPNASGDNNPDGGGVRDYDPVYSPRGIGGENNAGEDVELDASEGDTPLQEGEFQENPTGNVTVPYNEVFSDYASAADRALDQDYIPLGLRDVIRDYFSSLDPNQ